METIKNILDNINGNLKQMDGLKVNNMNEFHDTAKKLIKLGINNIRYLKPSVWRINFDNEKYEDNHINYVSEEIFRQDLDMKDDQRCKHERKGKVNQTKFSIAEKYQGIIEEMTIEELETYLLKEKHQSRIIDIDNSIAELQEKILKLNLEKESLINMV